MNVFRVAGDVSHTASKCILIWAIHSNKSAEGVSLVTQVLYFSVFTTRYLDLFWVPPWRSWWNFTLKNIYIWTSIYIVYIMTSKYARTREREKAWKLASYIVIFSLVVGPTLSMIYWRDGFDFVEMLWAFSIVMESLCVIPQLMLLRQTTVPTVIDSYYLVTLGAYRALYILNWIWRAAHKDYANPIAVVFGIVQTAFYIDFAWVYYTRQRVKLRGGTVVDSDDLRKGFLVNRFSHGRTSGEDLMEAGDENADNPRPRTNTWGQRGVSIRADDTLDTHDGLKPPPPRQGRGSDEDATPLTDPDHFLSDDENEDAPIIDPATISTK